MKMSVESCSWKSCSWKPGLFLAFFQTFVSPRIFSQWVNYHEFAAAFACRLGDSCQKYQMQSNSKMWTFRSVNWIYFTARVFYRAVHTCSRNAATVRFSCSTVQTLVCIYAWINTFRGGEVGKKTFFGIFLVGQHIGVSDDFSRNCSITWIFWVILPRNLTLTKVNGGNSCAPVLLRI